MDELEELLTDVRQNCAKLPIHQLTVPEQNTAKQLRLRATESVTAVSNFEGDENELVHIVTALSNVLQGISYNLRQWPNINRVESLVRQQQIVDFLLASFSGLLSVLQTLEGDVWIDFAKWQRELSKAQVLDVDALDELVHSILQNDYEVSLIFGVPREESERLRNLFEATIKRSSPERAEEMRIVLQRLEKSNAEIVPDMTGRVRLLGDQPTISGALADFWLGGTSSGNLVAVKLLRGAWGVGGDDGNDFIFREARIGVQLTHPNIVPTYGVSQIDERLGSISEWMRKGRAMDHIKADPSVDVLLLCLDLARGLQYMHSRGVVHGNLSPLCVLVSDRGSAMLSSFVFSHPDTTRDEVHRHQSTQTAWMDPGKLDWTGIEPYPAYVPGGTTKASDVLEFGSVICQLLTSLRVTRIDLFKFRSLDSRPPVGDWFLPDHSLRSPLWDVVTSCLMNDPAQRPTMDEVVTTLWTLSRMHRPSKIAIPIDILRTQVALPDLGAEIRKLGHLPITGGGFCDIWLGERLGREKVALKILKMYGVPDQIRKRFLKEATMWSQLKHPNILEFYGICDYGTSMSMVSPWLGNSNVLHYVTNVNLEANRYQLLCDASEGLQYLHTSSPPIIHGDLKCANILVRDGGTACLADFGLSKMHEEVTASSLRDAGSQRFMAPELFEGDKEGYPLKSLASDVYAFGQTILELLSGVKPFHDLQENLVYMAIARGQRPHRPETEIARLWLTDSVWGLILAMTEPSQQRRPKTDVVSAQLRSYWVMMTPARNGLQDSTPLKDIMRAEADPVQTFFID